MDWLRANFCDIALMVIAGALVARIAWEILRGE